MYIINMQYITFTQLRTNSKELAKAIDEGREVELVRRSAVIGKIIPQSQSRLKIMNAKKLDEKIQKLGLPKLTLNEIDRRYRAAMMKKHGKDLS